MRGEGREKKTKGDECISVLTLPRSHPSEVFLSPICSAEKHAYAALGNNVLVEPTHLPL